MYGALAVIGFVLVALSSEVLGSVLGWALAAIGLLGVILEARKRSTRGASDDISR